MTVAELIRQLLKTDDLTKEVYTFNDHEQYTIDSVDELDDRIDLNLGNLK
jgi:hypothetical protein